MHAQSGGKGRGLLAVLGVLAGGCSQQPAEPVARPSTPRKAVPDAYAAPRITSTFQSELRWYAGSRVTFRVVASDPQARALTITWTANSGTLGPPASESTASEAEWTSPPCMLTNTQPAITATVTNALGEPQPALHVVGRRPVDHLVQVAPLHAIQARQQHALGAWAELRVPRPVHHQGVESMDASQVHLQPGARRHVAAPEGPRIMIKRGPGKPRLVVPGGTREPILRELA